MARYIKEFRTNIHPELIHTSINQYLTGEGYVYTQYDGEFVFQKGQGVWANPTFFKITYYDNMVRVESWMKYVLFPGLFIGELSVDGFVGFAVKGPWKNRITNIENILSDIAIQTNYPSTTPVQNTANNLVYEGQNVYLNKNYSSEKTCIMNENQQDVLVDSAIFCSNCGTKMIEGALFCSECGQKSIEVSQQSNQARVYSQQFGQGNTYCSPEPTYTQATIGANVTRKEFIERYAQPHIKKDINNIAILCYICAGITFIVSCIISPVGIIDALALLGLSLGMHFAKSRVCAILIFVLGIVEFILSMFVGAVPIFWLIAGVSALVTFEKIEKQYKSFLDKCNRL